MSVRRYPQYQTYYRHRVEFWCRILSGMQRVDKDAIKVVGRFILSFVMLFLVYNGDVSGMVGVTAATITSGIDIAAFMEALKETRNQSQSEA